MSRLKAIYITYRSAASLYTNPKIGLITIKKVFKVLENHYNLIILEFERTETLVSEKLSKFIQFLKLEKESIET